MNTIGVHNLSRA